jgi:acetolactate synthase-1/2/3 large subunit
MTRQLDRVKPRRRLGLGRALARLADENTRSSCPSIRNLPDGVSIYVLGEAISEASAPDDVIVSGSSGSAIEVFCLAARLKEGQRLFLTTALGAMGNGLPGVIGACLANARRRTICVDGDGGLQLNIQELETMRAAGAADQAVRHEQRRLRVDPDLAVALFRPLAGADATSGVTLPPLRKVVEAFGLPYASIDTIAISRRDPRAARRAGPGGRRGDDAAGRAAGAEPVVDAKADGSMVSKPLEDLAPFLPRDEFRANMVIPPVDED